MKSSKFALPVKTWLPWEGKDDESWNNFVWDIYRLSKCFSIDIRTTKTNYHHFILSLLYLKQNYRRWQIIIIIKSAAPQIIIIVKSAYQFSRSTAALLCASYRYICLVFRLTVHCVHWFSPFNNVLIQQQTVCLQCALPRFAIKTPLIFSPLMAA